MTDMAYSRNERSISTFISMGWTPAGGPLPSALGDVAVEHLSHRRVVADNDHRWGHPPPGCLPAFQGFLPFARQLTQRPVELG